jgi:hypothetical protein
MSNHYHQQQQQQYYYDGPHNNNNNSIDEVDAMLNSLVGAQPHYNNSNNEYDYQHQPPQHQTVS